MKAPAPPVHSGSSSGEREPTSDRGFTVERGRFHDLSDDALLAATLTARRAAHDAPLNPYRLDTNWHRWIEQQSSAWSDRSSEWAALASEVAQRGLQQPAPDRDGDSRRFR